MSKPIQNLEPYVPFLNELVCLHSGNMVERYLGIAPKVKIFYVDVVRKPLFHNALEVSGHGETIREKMLVNPEAPLFISFAIVDNELTLSVGMLEGESTIVFFKLAGESLERLCEAQFKVFLMREEKALTRANIGRTKFLLSFRDMVELMTPKPQISFYLIMNQEYLGNIYQT